MTFRADFKAQCGWAWDSGARDENRLAFAASLSEGTDADQAEAVWHAEDQRLVEGASVTLDLAWLAKAVFGDVVYLALSGVRGLMLVQTEGAGRLVIGGDTETPWNGPLADADQAVVEPGGMLLAVHRRGGWAVDDAHRRLRIAAEGGEAAFSLVLVGTVTPASSSS